MSSYAPVWVKQDTRRFPRVVERGSEVEILSPLGAATEEADARAFTALMQHLKEVDSRDHTDQHCLTDHGAVDQSLDRVRRRFEREAAPDPRLQPALGRRARPAS